MLNSAPVSAMLPVRDPERARHFYEDQLGLEPLGPGPDGSLRYRCANTMITLLHRPDTQPAGHTALSFEVGNLESELSELESKGVVFQDYDLPNLRTEGHICSIGSEKAAWFLDSEGNCLCLHQTVH